MAPGSLQIRANILLFKSNSIKPQIDPPKKMLAVYTPIKALENKMSLQRLLKISNKGAPLLQKPVWERQQKRNDACSDIRLIFSVMRSEWILTASIQPHTPISLLILIRWSRAQGMAFPYDKNLTLFLWSCNAANSLMMLSMLFHVVETTVNLLQGDSLLLLPWDTNIIFHTTAKITIDITDGNSISPVSNYCCTSAGKLVISFWQND